MSIMVHQRRKNILQGVFGQSIPASVFATGVILAFGYAINLIYDIGDTRQLNSLLPGLLAGSLAFSIAAYVLKATKTGLLLSSVISLLLLIGAGYMMVATDLVLNSTDLLIIGLLMTSPTFPIGLLLRYGNLQYLLPLRLSQAIIQGIAVVLFVLIFSIYYESTGQVNLFAGPMFFLLLAIFYFTGIRLMK